MKELRISFLIMLTLVYITVFNSCREGHLAIQSNEPVKLIAWVRGINNYVAPPDYILKAVHQKILEDTGVDLKIIIGSAVADEFNMQLNNAIAAGEKIDIVQVSNIKTYYDQGILADLTDAINKYGSNILERQGQENMNQVLINGRYFGIPRNSIAGNTYPVWIRGDWLNKYQLSLPTTIEQFEDTLKIFAENDPSGNGTTIPLMTNGRDNRNVMGCIMSLSTAWLDFGYNDLNGQFIDNDGRLLPSILAPGFRDYLATLYRWYQNGYLPKDNYLLTSADQLDMIKAGRVGAWAGWYSYITSNEGIMQLNHPEAYYEKLNIEGPNGFAQSFVYSGGEWPAAYIVFNSCIDVDAAVRVLNWGFLDANYIYSKYAMDAEVEYKDGFYYYTIIKEPIGHDYQGIYLGPANESRFLLSGGDPLLKKHSDYTAMQMQDFRYGKFPLTGSIRFDRDLLNVACPRLPDINRMIDENLMAFLTGMRSLREYDNFINELLKIGFDKYINELTRQYNELKKIE